MNIWKYVLNGQTFGPVEIAQLQRLIDSGTLTRDSLLQKEGSAEWVPAHSLPELTFPAAQQAPPASQPVLMSSGASSSTPPPISEKVSDADDVEKNKVFAILAYIGLLFLVPLLAAPNSKFARFHTNQGIVLFLATFILMMGLMVLMMIPFIGCIASVTLFGVGAGALIMMIIGILNASAGRYKALPIIGHFVILK